MWIQIKPYILFAPIRLGGLCGAFYGLSVGINQWDKYNFPVNLITTITYGNIYMIGGFCAGAIWPIYGGGIYFYRQIKNQSLDTIYKN